MHYEQVETCDIGPSAGRPRKTALLCGVLHTEGRDLREPATSFRGVDNFDVVWDLVHEVPELFLAYDRLYMWDWYFDYVLDLLERHPEFEVCYVMSAFVDSGVIAPLAWPLEDQAEQAPLFQYANLLGSHVAESLDYPLYDDWSRLFGLIGELELARRKRRPVVVHREVQFDWISEIERVSRDRSSLRSIVLDGIERESKEIIDALEEYESLREGYEIELAELQQLKGMVDSLTNRRVRDSGPASGLLDALSMMVPDFEIVRYTDDDRVIIDIDTVFAWRAGQVALRDELAAIAQEAQRCSPTDTDYSANLAALFRSNCQRVEEMALDTYGGWKRFHTVLTSDLLSFLVDIGASAAGLLAGVPVPGAGLLPGAIGELTRRRLVAKAIQEGRPRTKVTWYTEWLDWQRSGTYEHRSAQWRFR